MYDHWRKIIAFARAGSQWVVIVVFWKDLQRIVLLSAAPECGYLIVREARRRAPQAEVALWGRPTLLCCDASFLLPSMCYGNGVDVVVRVWQWIVEENN